MIRRRACPRCGPRARARAGSGGPAADARPAVHAVRRLPGILTRPDGHPGDGRRHHGQRRPGLGAGVRKAGLCRAPCQTRTDTPFHLDGLTQLFAATLVLRCVEDGRLTLDTPVGTFSPTSPDASATIGQILTHTSGDPNDPTFAYRPGRLDVLASAVERVHGADRSGTPSPSCWTSWRCSIQCLAPTPSPTRRSAVERYTSILGRLAVPYAVDATGTCVSLALRGDDAHAVERADLDGARLRAVRQGLRQGFLLRPETLAAAWRPPVGRNGSLPHGYGWFVQTYNNEPVVWQFGVGANASSSSLVVTLPARGITLDPAGQQRRAVEAGVAPGGRHHGVAVCARLLPAGDQVGGAESCESA